MAGARPAGRRRAARAQDRAYTHRMKPLTPSERRALRAQAHHLDPVVIVGQHGLTPAVLHEIDLALLAHELVKVRVASDDRGAREAALAEVAGKLDCAPVQHLGKVLVLWRPNPDKAMPAPAPTPAQGKARGGRPAGPRAPVDPVRARRRARGDAGAPASGKGRRGAARHAPAATEPADASEAPAARRKSTFTPKTTPKSFSAKPNPRSAWQKKPAAPKPRAGAAVSGARKPASAKPRAGTTASGAGKPAAPKSRAGAAASGARNSAAGGTRRRRTGG